jgi:gas vesicle protein
MSLQNNCAPFFAGLVLGGLVGASVALLLVPQPGQETRAQIRNKGIELKDLTIKRCQDAGHRAQEQMLVWQEKGQEALEKGQHRAVEALGHGRERVIEAMSHGKDNLIHTLSFSRETAAETVASAAKPPV